MGQRRIANASLTEAFLPAGMRSNRRLSRIADLIDWAAIECVMFRLRVPDGPDGPCAPLARTALPALSQGSSAAVDAVAPAFRSGL